MSDTQPLFYLRTIPSNEIIQLENGQNCFPEEEARSLRTKLLDEKAHDRILVLPIDTVQDEAKVTSTVQSKTPKVIDIEKELTDTLKKRQFVETNTGWKSGFVRIVFDKNKVYIGHDIKGNKLTCVPNPLLNINSYINYFNRI